MILCANNRKFLGVLLQVPGEIGGLRLPLLLQRESQPSPSSSQSQEALTPSGTQLLFKVFPAQNTRVVVPPGARAQAHTVKHPPEVTSPPEVGAVPWISGFSRGWILRTTPHPSHLALLAAKRCCTFCCTFPLNKTFRRSLRQHLAAPKCQTGIVFIRDSHAGFLVRTLGITRRQAQPASATPVLWAVVRPVALADGRPAGGVLLRRGSRASRPLPSVAPSLSLRNSSTIL